MRAAPLEETVARPAVGPSCCSAAAAPVHTARLRTARARRPLALLGMLGPALTLALLVLTGRQSQASSESPDPKVVLSGARLQLPVPAGIQTGKVSIKWKVELRSTAQVHILTGKRVADSDHKCNPLKNMRCFIMVNWTLVIEAAQPQDSGTYVLEATNEMGETKNHKFNVSVLDPVGTPRLRVQQEALDGGKCRVTLSCSISGGGHASHGDVSYTWYRGSERILGPGNLSTLEEQTDGGPHAYTCRVSNDVSWANQTLRLSQGCLQEIGPQPRWIIVVSLSAAVLLLGVGTLTWVCVRRRRRKRAEPSPEGSLTVYEDVNNLRTRSGHEQRQEERDSPMAGTTIYSMIPAQCESETVLREDFVSLSLQGCPELVRFPSDFPSQGMENTLYSVVQPSQKSGSKKRKQSPSPTCTVYDEVGKIGAKAQSPVLTRKELENFRVYC